MTRGLHDVLASLGAPRVLVVGDLVLDRYLIGVVDRISPEAPIQVLRVEEESERLGGAGCVAWNVAVLGAHATLVGVLGGDAAAGRLSVLAAGAGVSLLAVVEAGRRTSVKTRHLARSHSTAQQVLRVDEETVAPVSAASEAAMLAHVAQHAAHSDAIVLSDYGKGALTPQLLARVLAAGRARGIPVLVDPKGKDFSRYRGATCITPNRPETAAATGIEVPDLGAAARASERLVRELALDFVLLTLDRDGMYLQPAVGPGAHLPTTPREVFDVTGAGDMVISVLGVALASGATPHEAAGLANVAAGLEVERVGVVPLTREEIGARLGLGLAAAVAKRLDPAEVPAVVARHRAAGRRIVFTNGCFDLLHAGHVRYLAEARSLGEVLIVGVNDDASVSRLKGPGRPLNPLADRVEVLAALAAVDHVVAFAEDVPTPLIARVQPDVLVKGSDWAEKGVAGRELVEARGGRVVLVGMHAGRSTTGLVERIRGR